MATQYKVNFFNASATAGSAIVFQQDPNAVPGMSPMALAWFAKYNYPQERVTFTWSTDLCFVWSDTGQLVPGIVASASQTIPADPQSTNQITLGYAQGFHFENPRDGGPQGSLTIVQDATIPAGMASVGIGMSGQPTFLTQAQPNMRTVFTPRTQYWIAFGEYVSGQVLKIVEIGKASQIVFPSNISAMDATYNPDGTWTIKPTHLAAEV